MKRSIIVHYGEIGLKGNNKKYFVKRLIKQIRDRLQKEFKITFKVHEVLKRLVIPLPDDFVEEKYISILNKIVGIKNFLFVYEGNLDLEKLSMEIWENIPKKELEESKTFCVRVKRSMIVPFKSIEAERDISGMLLKKGLNMKGDMKNPDLLINIELFSNKGYFSYNKYQGLGGLSAGTGGKLIALLSSGIDSPVAAYRMMRRGARIIFVHFHSYPFSDQEQVDQVKQLVEILSKYQFDTKLYLVPFGEIQKAISTNLEIPGKLRVVLYRRMMMRIAERISKKNKAKGLVTGDSFGQVASQTSENMFAIHESGTIPLYQPLISFDKETIVNEAREIGTFEISAKPCKDTCSMFTPKNPELRANVRNVTEMEKLLDFSNMIDSALEKSEIIFVR